MQQIIQNVKISDATIETKAIKSVLDSPDNIKTKLLSLLTTDLFGYPLTRDVMTRILTLIGRGKKVASSNSFCSDATISEEAKNLLESEMIKPITKEEEIEGLIEPLRFYATIRKMARNAQSTIDQLTEGSVDEEKVNKILADTERTVLTIRSEGEENSILHAGGGDHTLNPVVSTILNAKKSELIKSGFNNFDSRSGGFQRGNLLVLASRRGGGKTTVSLAMSLKQYFNKLNVCFVSLEMNALECTEKILANISGVSHEHIRLQKLSTLSERPKIARSFKAFEDFGNANNCRWSLYVPNKKMNPFDLEIQLKPFHYDVIYIDYINLLEPLEKNKPQHEQIGDNAKAMKLIAKSINCLIVTSAQMTADMEVKYSRAVEDHCDFLWVWPKSKTNILELDQTKARHAPEYPFKLKIERDLMQVEDYIQIPGQEEEEDQEEDKGKRGRRKKGEREESKKPEGEDKKKVWVDKNSKRMEEFIKNEKIIMEGLSGEK